MGVFKPFDPPRNKRGLETFYCEECHRQIPRRLVRRDSQGPYHYFKADLHRLLIIPTHPSEV